MRKHNNKEGSADVAPATKISESQIRESGCGNAHAYPWSVFA